MLTQPARQKWFLVKNPDGLLRRRDAVSLIHRHADQVRVYEDLGGHSALMVAEGKALRLVLFRDLSDAQIDSELQEAWRREHFQADLFRDALLEPANDEYQPTPVSEFQVGLLRFLGKIWNWRR